MFIIFLKVIFILTCIFLILCVLLQSGKGGDVASAFGGSGSQTAFGPRGAQKPLEKATVVSAVIFMFLALLFSLPGVGTNSVVRDSSSPVTPPPASTNPVAAPSASPAATSSPTGLPTMGASPAAKVSVSPSPTKK